MAGNTNQTITFESNSGPLLARRNGDVITLDFPLNPVQPYDRNKAMPLIQVHFLYFYLIDERTLCDLEIMKVYYCAINS